MVITTASIWSGTPLQHGGSHRRVQSDGGCGIERCWVGAKPTGEQRAVGYKPGWHDSRCQGQPSWHGPSQDLACIITLPWRPALEACPHVKTFAGRPSALPACSRQGGQLAPRWAV